MLVQKLKALEDMKFLLKDVMYQSAQYLTITTSMIDMSKTNLNWELGSEVRREGSRQYSFSL